MYLKTEICKTYYTNLMQEICVYHVNISCQMNHRDTFPIKEKIPKTMSTTGGEVVVFHLSM